MTSLGALVPEQEFRIVAICQQSALVEDTDQPEECEGLF
jgi:hypothetical protein